jgi:hypothetical protein
MKNRVLAGAALGDKWFGVFGLAIFFGFVIGKE